MYVDSYVHMPLCAQVLSKPRHLGSPGAEVNGSCELV